VTSSTAQAVILAAGKGTRMRSARAKVLHPVLGVPLLEHVLRAVHDVAADPVTIVVGHEASAVQAAFEGRGRFVVQEPPLGTGHALQVARQNLASRPDQTALVVNGDLPLLRGETLAALLESHRRSGADATLMSAELLEPGAYGRVLRDRDGSVQRIVEARDATPGEREIREINAGIYAFEIPSLLEVLDRLRPQNAQGEYYLTDLIALLNERGRRVSAVKTADPGEVLGVNTMAELAEVSRQLQDRVLDRLMASGVRIEDPESTCIGADVVVEPDAVVRPFTFLEGRTVVRATASVGPFARVVDSEIGPGALVLDHCLVLESVIEAGASIGPFAHLRPQSRVGARAKVGNFVELKKTHLGEGAKAPHLSYLGDATIGARVNVGAGTITCNYDGTSKHPTHIGAGAFIGSDTTLVAPVSVGEGAYVGAGSAITEDVPPGALALGRARQVVKEGWVERRRRVKESKEAG
jgi:bifunctional UDP-N-acetylglucosamine pyrophosphorylase / glucosamine-1-phosphate N-acetyltransferase